MNFFGSVSEIASQLPSSAGVYRMLSENEEILYIGKARNLKKRVASYGRTQALPHRLQRMVHHMRSICITQTETEHEALILEATLIQKHQPVYNILLKDGKGMAYLMMTDGTWPRLFVTRDRHSLSHPYIWGPWMSSQPVSRTLVELQRVFGLRPCSDATMRSRKRPCLLYDLGRCAAPCVEKIDAASYQERASEVRKFLSGRTQDVMHNLLQKMQRLSQNQDYIPASKVRNRIKALRHIQSTSMIHTPIWKEGDIVIALRRDAWVLFAVWSFQNHHRISCWSSTLKTRSDEALSTLMARFLAEYYKNYPPTKILVNIMPQDAADLRTLFHHYRKNPVDIVCPSTGKLRALVQRAMKDEQSRFDQSSSSQWEALQHKVGKPLTRVEVYDNSHCQGKHSIGAMIVSGPNGWEKSEYRAFPLPNMRGDDGAMTEFMLRKRFQNLDTVPELLIVDGGAYQYAAATKVMDDLGLQCTIWAMAKGPGRKGPETFYTANGPFQLSDNDPLLYYLQRLRDEAHRFAITRHRHRRQKSMTLSAFDQIPGIGPSRRQSLLYHLGSWQAVQESRLEDLEKIPGFSKHLARVVYQYTRPS